MRQIFGRDHFGARAHHQIAKALGKGNFRRTHLVAAARAPGGAAAIGGVVGVGKVDRAALGRKQRHDLTQRQVQDFVEIEGLRRHHGHGVERVQFAIAAPHLVFGAALFRHVEDEALVALDVSGAIAPGEAAFDRQQKRAVLAAQGHVEIANVIVGFHFLAEIVPLAGIDADFGIQIQHQQLFARAVAEHVDEGVVAIDDPARRRGDVDALLYLLKQQPVFFLGRAAVGDVAYDVDDALLRAALLGVRRSRDDREAAEAGVRAFGEFFVRAQRAVGASGPLAKGVGQSGLASAADDVGGRLAQMFEQNLIGLDDAEVGVVRQNDVVDGVERIHPLPLRAQYLLEQAEVLYCNRQLQGAGLQEVEFFGGPAAVAGISQQQQSDGRLSFRPREA